MNPQTRFRGPTATICRGLPPNPAAARLAGDPSYKGRVQEYFAIRSMIYDDNNSYHRKLAMRLLQYAELQQGDLVLDVASGTGLVACLAAQSVGPRGKMLGVDISAKMLEKVYQ